MARMTDRRKKFRIALSALVLGVASAAGVQGADYTVSSSAEFAQAIVDINADPMADHRIILSQDIALAAQPLAVMLTSGSLTVVGNSHAIDGSGQYRAFFVESGAVTLENLSVANGRAQGGRGADGTGAGGGGLGAGGAVFVDSGAHLTIKNVNFTGNTAGGGNGGNGFYTGGAGGGGMGGNGGQGDNSVAASGGGGGLYGTGGNGGGAASGGGGGLLGSGGSGVSNSGGGGGGMTATGGDGSSGAGGTGGAPGGNGGHNAHDGDNASGLGGGGGGSGSFPSAGGAGATFGGGGGGSSVGGAGGAFGGGGGGATFGGNGGFGGGGGGAGNGSPGDGGFGAGGGGGLPDNGTAAALGYGTGQGGFGGGNGTTTTFPDFTGGGGGAGFGGALFVREGGSITIVDSAEFSGNTAVNGLGGISFNGYFLAADGSHDGNDLFLMSGVSTTFDIGAGQSLNFAPAIGNDDGVNYGVELAKTGEGTLTLSGANPWVSSTYVDQGTLVVDGSLGSFDIMTGRISAMEIDTLGVIAGNGTINGYVENYGRISPGTAAGDIGTLTVNGVYLQGSEGVYDIDINAAGQSDRIDVTYAAELTCGCGPDGGDLFIRAQPGTYTNGQRYTILTTGFGLFDTFGLVSTSGMPYFWTASVEYDAFNAYLVLSNDGLTPYAQTWNQINTAEAVMDTATTSDPTLDSIYSTMNGMTGAGKRDALDQLSGELYGTLASSGIQGTSAWLGAIGDRLRPAGSMSAAGGQGLAGTQFLRPLEVPASRTSDLQFASYDRAAAVRTIGTSSSDKSSVPIVSTSGPNGTLRNATNYYGWIGGYGLGGAARSDGNAQGFNYGSGGTLFGVDRQLSDDLVVGVAGGYAGSHVLTASRQQSAQVDSSQVAPYIRLMHGPGYVFGVAGFSHDVYQSTRQLPAAVTARGAYAGNQFSTYLEGGSTYALGSWNVQPLVNLQYIALQQDGFTETGAGGAGLTVRSSLNDSLRPGVGLRVAKPTVVGGVIVVPDVHARYAYELLDPDRLVIANFSGVVGGSFLTAGNQLGHNFGQFGVGLNAAFTPSVGGYLGYDAITADRSVSHLGSGGLQVAW